VNKNALKIVGVAMLIAVAPGAVKAVELLSTSDMSINVGGRFTTVGQLEWTSDNQNSPFYQAPTTTVGHVVPSGSAVTNPGAITSPSTNRDNARVYLWQTENRLLLSGSLDGVKFYFEDVLGGEAINTSNNQMTLLKYYADVPVVDNASVVVGQFKMPSNLASNIDDGSLLFTQKSPLFSDFFNQGYDDGLALRVHGSMWDATAGTSLNDPDAPQRYLPEMFNMVPPVFTRFGVGNIADNPYEQKQVVDKLTDNQWGLHGNAQYMRNSSAGHSNLLGLQSGELAVVDSVPVFGNALLWNGWNPFLGRTASGAGTAPDYDSYWNASVDAEFRTVVSDKTDFLLTAQWSFAEYTNPSMAALDGLTAVTTNLNGGELVVALNGDQWALAARFDMVCPSDNLIYNNTAVAQSSPTGKAGTYAPVKTQENEITGAAPIYEITFPSITYRVNKYFRLTAETMYWLNAPEVSGDDGVYELIEMPSQYTNIFSANPTVHNPFVAVARLGATLAF